MGMSSVSVSTNIPFTRSEARASRLAELFEIHHARLYGLARRLSASRDDALDLVQETFVRAARSVRSVPIEPSRAEAWLVRTLVNIQRDQWRKLKVRQRFSDEQRPSAESGGGQEAAILARIAVRRSLNTLPPRRRAVVVLHELEGRTVSAIAATLGIAAVTVRWHLSMGRRDLARALKPDAGENR